MPGIIRFARRDEPRFVLLRVTLAGLVFVLSGCTSDGVKRGVYEGLVRKQCNDGMNETSCEADHATYEEYLRERERLIGVRCKEGLC
ncbi:MAG: hypothetical protein B7Z03_08895 [Hydrogenophilales bacterium 32-62-9]|nr:MAG: hypothetical protein B7Z03_08895 [Hydrogenophilales bacterium 32-62-9]